MRINTRTAAVAVAAALTFGAGGPAVAAANGDHARPGHVKVEKGEKGDKGDKKAGQAQRQVLRDIAKTDAKLTKVADRTSRVGEHAGAVLANVDADRAALADLATAVTSADSTLDLRELRRSLKSVRVQNYGKVINDLRHALRLTDKIEDARLDAEGDPVVLAELDVALAAVSSAVAKALLVTASSDKSELRAVKADLQAAHAALDGVSDDSDEEPVEEEPVEEEPVEEEPAEEEPVVEEPVTP